MISILPVRVDSIWNLHLVGSHSGYGKHSIMDLLRCQAIAQEQPTEPRSINQTGADQRR